MDWWLMIPLLTILFGFSCYKLGTAYELRRDYWRTRAEEAENRAEFYKEQMDEFSKQAEEAEAAERQARWLALKLQELAWKYSKASGIVYGCEEEDGISDISADAWLRAAAEATKGGE